MVGERIIFVIDSMVGVLVEIGRGRLSEQDLKQYLNSRSNEPAKYTAPPSGLFLEQIIYKGESLNPELKPMVFSTKVLKRKESVK